MAEPAIRRHNPVKKRQLNQTCHFLFPFESPLIVHETSESSKGFARSNSWLVWVAFVVTFGSIIALACCGDLRRRFPVNFILLGIFTLAEALTMGIITAFYDTTIVVTAIAITAVVCLALTAFAMQTKIDFTVYNGAAFICLLVLMLMGLAVAIFPGAGFLRILYSGLGALLFSFFLLIDTQMIVGGNRQLQISPEEYIMAVITLYLDILQLFLHILQLLNASK